MDEQSLSEALGSTEIYTQPQPHPLKATGGVSEAFLLSAYDALMVSNTGTRSKCGGLDEVRLSSYSRRHFSFVLVYLFFFVSFLDPLTATLPFVE